MPNTYNLLLTLCSLWLKWGMAGHFMAKGEVTSVVVGADRIASNGDTANKIGTYTVAVLARENDLPFYVAAPLSTVDFDIASGDQIPIEQRDGREVSHIRDQAISPEGVPVSNPAFDVTPHRYVSAIITDAGIARPPFKESLARLRDAARRGRWPGSGMFGNVGVAVGVAIVVALGRGKFSGGAGVAGT